MCLIVKRFLAFGDWEGLAMFCGVDCMVVDDPHEVVDSPDCAMFEVVQDGRNWIRMLSERTRHWDGHDRRRKSVRASTNNATTSVCNDMMIVNTSVCH